MPQSVPRTPPYCKANTYSWPPFGIDLTAGSLAIWPPQIGPAPPQPAHTATYCLPSTTYVVGTPMIPELSWSLVHSTLPVLASNAMKCPSVLPLNIRPPEVARVAPDQGRCVSCCQTCLPVFRSTACTEPQLSVVGSCLTSKVSSRNASPAL